LGQEMEYVMEVDSIVNRQSFSWDSMKELESQLQPVYDRLLLNDVLHLMASGGTPHNT